MVLKSVYPLAGVGATQVVQPGCGAGQVTPLQVIAGKPFSVAALVLVPQAPSSLTTIM